MKTSKEKTPQRQGSERRTLLGREDWIKTALEVLADLGPAAVTVASIATKLGVTKGSFYWHFQSREELLDCLIEEWRLHATRRVIQIVDEEASSAREKILRVTSISSRSSVHELGGALELTMRTWAKSNRKVRTVVAEVDKSRMAFLAQQYAEIRSDGQADLVACLHYAFSAGLRLIFSFSDEEKSAIRDQVIEGIFFSDHPIEQPGARTKTR